MPEERAGWIHPPEYDKQLEHKLDLHQRHPEYENLTDKEQKDLDLFRVIRYYEGLGKKINELKEFLLTKREWF